VSPKISPVNPNTPIKVERVSDLIENIYDVSPRDYVYKAADVGRRQTSRSTAQLTTPGSSPEPKRETAVMGATILKMELIHEGDVRKSLFETSCTPPASSPEGFKVSKRPTGKVPPTKLQRPLFRMIQASKNQQDRREISDRAEKSVGGANLSSRPFPIKYNGSESAVVSGNVFSTKIGQTQKAYERPTAYESQSGTSPIQFPPIIPSRVRPSSPKTTAPNPGSTRYTSILPLTPQGELALKEGITTGKACCSVRHLRCAPKEGRDESSLGLLGQHPRFSRLRSVSACPSSVSSFGPDDDIPPSSKIHQEFERAITESARTIASNHMSEISPSLKYNDLLTRLGILHETRKDMEEISIYENLEGESLPKENPCKVIFGKLEINNTDYGRTELSMTPRRFCSTEENGQRGNKKLQRIPSRSLRSFSLTNNLSKKRGESVERQEYNSENELSHGQIGDKYWVEDESSGSEYDEMTTQKLPTQKPLNMTSSGQSVKRARETTHDLPSFSDDEEIVAEDEIVEIDRDVFAVSENRRKKRHKSSLEETEPISILASPVPKKEPSEGTEAPSAAVEDSMTIETGFMDNAGTRVLYTIELAMPQLRPLTATENIQQERMSCTYYMNTYWDHGRASDGRRVRDGFTSYADFKEYCRKNKQPIDDRCILTYKKDLKHYLLCEYHATLRQDLFRAAWNFERNPGFSFKSSNKDEETRRLQNEAIGNVSSPRSSSKGSAAAKGTAAQLSEEELNALITRTDVIENENKKLRMMLKACQKKSKRRS
jgi:hypothetical protein